MWSLLVVVALLLLLVVSCAILVPTLAEPTTHQGEVIGAEIVLMLAVWGLIAGWREIRKRQESARLLEPT
jgi:protein-S-isoprenylcysteine O-methyltransferase Ste14